MTNSDDLTGGAAASRAKPDREHVIGDGLKWIASWSIRIVCIALGAVLIAYIIKLGWSVVLPVSLALIFTTVLQPPAYFLERKLKLPPALSAATVILGSFAIVGVVVWLVAPSVGSGSNQIAHDAVKALDDLRGWLADSSLGVSANQIDEVIASAQDKIQENAGTIASGVLVGVNVAANIIVNLVIALVLTFLFIKDGRRFLPWTRKLAGPTAGPHLYEVGQRIWSTLGGFIRTQAFVSLIDAVFIYIGLIIVGVPLAFPLALITFFGGFIPIVGAFVAGAIAVLIALVSVGPIQALIVLGIIIAVQQLEGNVLSPMLQSKSMQLHAAVVLLSVTLGSTQFGIIGAFLAVPVAATVAVILRYINEQISLRSADQDPDAEHEDETVVDPPNVVPDPRRSGPDDEVPEV